MKRILTATASIVAILMTLGAVLPVQPTRADSNTITFAIIGDYGMANDPELQVANMVKGGTRSSLKNA